MVALRHGVPWVIVLAMASARCMAADQWMGSLSLTSDYIVRGISRTNDGAALQLDLTYLSPYGFLAGLFVSNTQFDAGDRRDAELDGYLGYAWTAGNDWSGRILGSHYTYPWNQDGSGWDYDEFDVSVVFQGWLGANIAYSPNQFRYAPSGALIGVPAESGELNLQRPVVGKLSALAGLGYSHLDGPNPGGYTYWSLGAAYRLAPVSLVVAYVDTSSGAKAIFYDEAVSRRWTGTVIWRF